MRVLLIITLRAPLSAIRGAFRDQGCVVDGFDDRGRGGEAASALPYAVIVVGGPGTSELCGSMRGRGVAAPILVVGIGRGRGARAKASVHANDHLSGPFGLGEVVERARSLVRRGRGPSAQLLRVGSVELDVLTRRATLHGAAVTLTDMEYNLLVYLMRNPDRVVTREELADQVWAGQTSRRGNLVDRYISMLRRKLKVGRKGLIRTVNKGGYVLQPAPPRAVHPPRA